MKIGETKAARPARGVGPRTRGAETARESAGVDGTADVTSIMGIPEAELTPKVRAAMMALMEEVGRLRQELEQTRQRTSYLERLADQDSLVPVVNRRAFVRELSRMVSFSQRYGTPSSLLFFDMNELKVINDTFGHAAGDAALARVVDVLLENVRESDVVGRLGGDEFGVILAQADESQAAEKAALLAAAIGDAPLEWEDKRIALSLAYGTYTFRGGDDAGAALQAADDAMYRHKKSVGGRG